MDAFPPGAPGRSGPPKSVGHGCRQLLAVDEEAGRRRDGEEHKGRLSHLRLCETVQTDGRVQQDERDVREDISGIASRREKRIKEKRGQAGEDERASPQRAKEREDSGNRHDVPAEQEKLLRVSLHRVEHDIGPFFPGERLFEAVFARELEPRFPRLPARCRRTEELGLGQQDETTRRRGEDSDVRQKKR